VTAMRDYNGMSRTDYRIIHRRKRRYDGKASEYECVDCGDPARDWSFEHDTDPWNLDNYVPRCRRCHALYDGESDRRNYVVEQRELGRTYQSIADELGVRHVGRMYSNEIGRREREKQVRDGRHLLRNEVKWRSRSPNDGRVNVD
jgi:hypothetical protein